MSVKLVNLLHNYLYMKTIKFNQKISSFLLSFQFTVGGIITVKDRHRVDSQLTQRHSEQRVKQGVRTPGAAYEGC